MCRINSASKLQTIRIVMEKIASFVGGAESVSESCSFLLYTKSELSCFKLSFILKLDRYMDFVGRNNNNNHSIVVRECSNNNL